MKMIKITQKEWFTLKVRQGPVKSNQSDWYKSVHNKFEYKKQFNEVWEKKAHIIWTFTGRTRIYAVEG